MRESHANKSISFLMELIFVLFFFTLASAVCVLVLGTAKDKNNLAADTRNALPIWRKSGGTAKDSPGTAGNAEKIFYLDENGKPVIFAGRILSG